MVGGDQGRQETKVRKGATQVRELGRGQDGRRDNGERIERYDPPESPSEVPRSLHAPAAGNLLEERSGDQERAQQEEKTDSRMTTQDDRAEERQGLTGAMRVTPIHVPVGVIQKHQRDRETAERFELGDPRLGGPRCSGTLDDGS